MLCVVVATRICGGKRAAVMRSSLSTSSAGCCPCFSRPGRARCFDALSDVSISPDCKFVTLQSRTRSQTAVHEGLAVQVLWLSDCTWHRCPAPGLLRGLTLRWLGAFSACVGAALHKH